MTRPVSDFEFSDEEIALPSGAYARTHRRRLMWRGRTLLAVTQGDFRNYLYPLTTPAGFAVTEERPADHPHHASLWIGADHVNALVPTPGGIEEYTYNFYVDDIFQGRAPGRIVETAVSGRALSDTRFEIAQDLTWRGPVEWGAPGGREIAFERRVTVVTAGERCHRIDVSTQLTPAEYALRLGPTRHALFNARVADGLTVVNGGTVRDDRGQTDCPSICGPGARWVDMCGEVGGGQWAGITMIPAPDPGNQPFWFVTDWGVMTTGTFRSRPVEIGLGAEFRAACTYLVHDGALTDDEIERMSARGSP